MLWVKKDSYSFGKKPYLFGSLIAFFLSTVFANPSISGQKPSFLADSGTFVVTSLIELGASRTRAYRALPYRRQGRALTLLSNGRRILQNSRTPVGLSKTTSPFRGLSLLGSPRSSIAAYPAVPSNAGGSAKEIHLTSEESNHNPGTYLFPNEFDNYVYRPLISNKTGVLVAVGTLRALFDASLGNFSRVILLDVDSLVTEFNQVNLNLIRDLSKSGLTVEEQRYQYLAILHHRWIPEEFLNQLTRLNGNDPFKIAQLLKEIPRLPELDCNSLPQEIKESTTHLAQLIARAFGPRDSARPAYSDSQNPFYLLSKRDQNSEMTYWGNDELWTKIQKMIFENRFYPITGDLSGSTTLKNIATELDRVQEQVSVVDISNVLEYLAKHDRLEDDQSVNRFLANLKALPKEPDSLLLVTSLQYDTSLYSQLKLSDSRVFLDWYYLFGRLGASDFPYSGVSLEKEVEIY